MQTSTIKDYEAGKEVFYHEGGDCFKVRILRSLGDSDFEKYELEVVEFVSENPLYLAPEMGNRFVCEKKRGITCGGLWQLLDS